MTLDVDEAIEYLEKLEEKLRQFPAQVAMDSVDRIEYPNVTADIKDGECVISAMGDKIAFEEFGAGFEADTFMYKDFRTRMGVWSEDHARTFQNWEGEPIKYHYNRTPKRYLREEAERLPSMIMAKAKEVFNDH